MCAVISNSCVSKNQQRFDKVRQKLELNSFFRLNHWNTENINKTIQSKSCQKFGSISKFLAMILEKHSFFFATEVAAPDLSQEVNHPEMTLLSPLWKHLERKHAREYRTLQEKEKQRETPSTSQNELSQTVLGKRTLTTIIQRKNFFYNHSKVMEITFAICKY